MPVHPTGTLEYFGYPNLLVQGSFSVRLTGARVRGAPRSLDVKVYGAHFLNGGYPGGLTDTYFQQKYSGLELHPVTDVQLHEGDKQDWYLLFIVTSHTRGKYAWKYIEITYDDHGKKGKGTFPFGISGEFS